MEHIGSIPSHYCHTASIYGTACAWLRLTRLFFSLHLWQASAMRRRFGRGGSSAPRVSPSRWLSPRASGCGSLITTPRRSYGAAGLLVQSEVVVSCNWHADAGSATGSPDPVQVPPELPRNGIGGEFKTRGQPQDLDRSAATSVVTNPTRVRTFARCGVQTPILEREHTVIDTTPV